MTSYRRIYKPLPHWKAVFILIGAALVLAGIYCFNADHAVDHRQTSLLGFIWLFFGFYCIARILRFKIVLRPEAITIHDILGKRQYKREDIAGWRLTKDLIPTLLIIHKKAGKRKIRIPKIIQSDPEFESWITSLPEISADDEKTLDVRGRKKIKKDNRHLGLVITAFILFYFVGFIFVQPYTLPHTVIILLALVTPIIAVLLKKGNPEKYVLVSSRKDGRIGLDIFLVLSALYLFARVFVDFPILHFGPVIHTMAIAGAALIVVLLSRLEPKADKKILVPVLFLMLIPYTYGTLITMDVFLDRSEPRVFETTVTGKRINRGRRSDTHYLTLAPWGPQTASKETQVDYSLYYAYQPGQKACVLMGEGALNMPWYRISHCQAL